MKGVAYDTLHARRGKRSTNKKRDVLSGEIIIQFVYIMRNCSAVDKQLTPTDSLDLSAFAIRQIGIYTTPAKLLP